MFMYRFFLAFIIATVSLYTFPVVSEFGIIVLLPSFFPMVNTAAEAQRAGEACRYPPDGSRSCGPMRDAMLEGFHYLKSANAEIAFIAMIETREGLENVDAIAATKGQDAIFVGPVGLCYGVGITPGDFGSADFIDAIDRIKAAVAKAGCALGLFGYTP